MGLSATLNVHLDCSALGTGFLAAILPHESTLNVLVAPSPGAQLDPARPADGFSLGPITAAIGRFSGQAGPVLAGLPAVGELLGPLTRAIDWVERAGAEDPAAQIEALLARIKLELDSPNAGGQTALLLRIADLLCTAPEGGVLRELLMLLIERAGIGRSGAGALPFLDGLRGLDGAVQILGAMMSLETVLAEAERLTGVMAITLDPRQVQEQIADLQATLTGGPQPLAAVIAGLAVDDSSGLAIAEATTAAVATRLRLLGEQIGTPMAMGQATLSYLDIDQLQREIDGSLARLRAADAAPLRRFVASLEGLVAPFLAFDPGGTPAGGLAALLGQVESQVAGFAAQVASLDVARFAEPLAAVIHTLTTPLRELDALLERLLASLRAALDSIRAAIAALPIDDIADVIRRFVAPIATALQTVTDVVDGIQDALELAAGAVSGALTEIDKALDALKQQVDSLFGGAKQALDALDLDQVIGTVASNIEAFSELLGQAQMQPIFATAVDAIGGAADVIEQVPFGLLPESMKAEVDAAVAPIKAVDAAAIETEVEALLGIVDGRFAPRADLEAALEAIAAQYQALLTSIEQLAPREQLREVDRKFAELAQRIETLAPDLTLQPVRDAIDGLKAAVAAVDLRAQLAPVTDAFATITAALDGFSVGELLAPVQTRLDAARSQIKSRLQLDRWDAQLEALAGRAVDFLDVVDPARLAPPLEGALAEVRTLIARLPSGDSGPAVGTVLAALLGATGLRIAPSSWIEVRRWLAGASADEALRARSGRVAMRLAAVQATVSALDLQTWTVSVRSDTAALAAAITGLLASLPAGSDRHRRFAALLPQIDAGVRFDLLIDNRSAFLAQLGQAVQRAESFRRSGYAAADAGADQLRAAFAPLAPAKVKLQGLFAAIGIAPDRIGVNGILEILLDAAPPARLIAIVMPVFTALQGRLRALIDAVIAPLRAALAELRALIDAVDLTPLTEGADAVVNQLKTELEQLNPLSLLAEPLSAFDALKQAIAGSDPLAALNAIITALRTLISKVLAKLSLEKLLETPLAIYDEVLADLRQLDPTGLLTPVFDQLDALALQVDEGLDDTVSAFRRLQDALPAGGGGSSVSVSVSV